MPRTTIAGSESAATAASSAADSSIANSKKRLANIQMLRQREILPRRRSGALALPAHPSPITNHPQHDRRPSLFAKVIVGDNVI
jgi:hypothetical protein